MRHNYTSGSISAHLARLAGSMMVSLLFVYSIGLVDIFFLSRLSNEFVLAAIGTASVISLPLVAVSVAFAHTVSILVAREIGKNDIEKASIAISNLFTLGLVFTALVSVLVFIFLDPIVDLFDISNEAASQSKFYISLMLPSNVLTTLWLMSNFAARALGDMKSPMIYTLIGSGVSILLIVFFATFLEYGLFESFLAITVGRIIGPLLMVRKLLKNTLNVHFKLSFLEYDYMRMTLNYYVPILLSNLIMPVSALFVMYILSTYGDPIVAGYTVATRITSVVFCIIFVIPGAISPIVSQNYGAGKFDRILTTAVRSVGLSAIYVILVSAVLSVFREELIQAFYLVGGAADILDFYLKYMTTSFVWASMFVASTGILNSIAYQYISTKLVLFRALFLIMPFVYFAASIGDQNTVLMAEYAAIAVSSIIAYYFAIKAVRELSSSKKM